jgi:hypothetical protein
MKTSPEIFNDIKSILTSIKTHGGYIDQYDAALFKAFVEAYQSNYIVGSDHSLTADQIAEKLASDANYSSILSKTPYDLDQYFCNKWFHWTEAFRKGLEGGYIHWPS